MFSRATQKKQECVSLMKLRTAAVSHYSFLICFDLSPGSAGKPANLKRRTRRQMRDAPSQAHKLTLPELSFNF